MRGRTVSTHAHIYELAGNSSWKDSVMEGADLVEGLLDDREDMLVSSVSRLAWILLLFGIASHVHVVGNMR